MHYLTIFWSMMGQHNRHIRPVQSRWQSSNKLILIVGLSLILFVPNLIDKQQISFNVNSPIQFASANYLEQAGRISQMVNQLIDRLLEKISFLADLIIESSLEEHCEPVKCNSNNNELINQSSNDANNDIGSDSARKMSVIDEPKMVKKLLDKLEYENTDYYINLFKARMDMLQRQQEEQQAESKQQSTSSSSGACKLFNLPLGSSELPVVSMENCCKQYSSCYGQCGQTKHYCDDQFRLCLSTICREKFDYTNHSVVVRHARYVRSLNMAVAEAEEDLEEELAANGMSGLNKPAMDNEEFVENSYNYETKPIEDSEDFAAIAADGDDIFDQSSLHDSPNDEADSENAAESSSESRRRRRRRKRSIAKINNNNNNENEPEDLQNKVKDNDNDNANLLWSFSEREQKQVRDKYKACKLASKILIIGNLAFGCHAFKQAQFSACCPLQTSPNSPETTPAPATETSTQTPAPSEIAPSEIIATQAENSQTTASTSTTTTTTTTSTPLPEIVASSETNISE